jgi:hypothetical protein
MMSAATLASGSVRKLSAAFDCGAAAAVGGVGGLPLLCDSHPLRLANASIASSAPAMSSLTLVFPLRVFSKM